MLKHTFRTESKEKEKKKFLIVISEAFPAKEGTKSFLVPLFL